MSRFQPRWPTLARAMVRMDDIDGLLLGGLLVVAGTAVLTVSAKIQLPFWPVPITMQTLVVLLIGAVYGLRLGIATVAIYLAEGAIGWPVFATGGGYDYFVGPSGGFLIGFLVAAAVVGYLAEHGFDRRWQTALFAFLIGDAVLFGFGVAWLTHLFGFSKALSLGLLPYLPAEAVKVTLAMVTLPFAWKYIGRYSCYRH